LGRSAPMTSRTTLLVALGAGALVLFSLGILLLTAPRYVYDWRDHFYYYDWIRHSLLRWHVLPLYMADALHTTNFFANPQSPFGPLVGLLLLLPTAIYIKLLIFVYATAGVLGMFALLHDHGVQPEVAVLAGVVFAFNGFFASHLAVGHHWTLGVYALPALLWSFRRALAGSVRALWAGAALNAAVAFEGSHHAFLWQNTFLVLYTLGVCFEKRSIALVRPALLFLGASMGLSAVKLLPMISEFATYDPTTAWGPEVLERIPALPLSAAPFALIGRGQSIATTRPDVAFAFGSGWWEYALYVGGLGLTFLVGGTVCALGQRRSWRWLLPGGFFLLVALNLQAILGRFQLWSLLTELPFWRSQRCPSRCMVLAIFSFAVLAALGLQRLLERIRSVSMRELARMIVVVLTLAIAFDLEWETRPWQGLGQTDPVPGEDHDHFPQLRMIGGIPSDTISLDALAPHRFVVTVHASRGGKVVLPRESARSLRNWQIAGGEATDFEGRLAVRVEPGVSTVVFVFDPPWLRLGLVISLVTALAGLRACVREARQRRLVYGESHLAAPESSTEGSRSPEERSP